MKHQDESFQTLLKMGLESGQIPSILYKYRPLNENTDKIFTESSLWFSSPLDFNDPFDCQHELDTNNTEEEIIEYLKAQDGVPQETIILAAKNMMSDPKRWEELNKDIIQKKINETGILCLSKKNDDILMWSHYSDCHRGIVLGFDLSQDLDFFAPVISIKYEKEYPVYNYLRDKNKFADILIRQKSDHWSYEQEYRVVKMNQTGAVKFKKETLKEVIFGCKCKNEEIERIKKSALSSGFTPIFSIAHKNNKQYKLDVTVIH
ncbi:MAG: DUF2971 domain-containing protein [Chitinophagaceae bacterium]|nr:DUF2971 domain-containing protein [Chitinophagaceae bacterium]